MLRQPPKFKEAIEALARHRVDFIVVGGVGYSGCPCRSFCTSGSAFPAACQCLETLRFTASIIDQTTRRMFGFDGRAQSHADRDRWVISARAQGKASPWPKIW